VSLEIFSKVKHLPLVNQPVNSNTPEGTFVALFSSTSRKQVPSAFGYICNKDTALSPIIEVNDGTPQVRNIKRKSISIIRLVKILVPALLFDEYNFPDITLESFAPGEIIIAVKRTWLRTASESLRLFNQPDEPVTHETMEVERHNNEPASVEEAQKLPSRILKDPFHLMDMIKVNLNHGIAKDFSRRFRDCLFVVDPEDKTNVEEYLNSIGSSWESYLVEKPDFLFERARRYIPPHCETKVNGKSVEKRKKKYH
jgi:hypothetical protein